MISMRKKFLFIHVPKTGGNSIQTVLRNYSEDDIVVRAEQDGVERFKVCNKKYHTTKHSPLNHYKSAIEADMYRSLFKFATIRNPWDMMISYYFSPHRGVTEWNRDDFLALVDAALPFPHYLCEESFTDRVLSKFRIQRTGVGKRLDANLDYIMRFEYLDHDFSAVCEKLDIPKSPLPKRNASPREHYSKYYDDELREIVHRKFRRVIKFGNYRFEDIQGCAHPDGNFAAPGCR